MTQPTAATTPAPAPASRLTPDLLRRLLLVLVTALLVAAPLVPGEDPGLLGPAPGAGGLTLALLWLLAAVAWAAWRLWSGDATWQGGLAEAGLLLVTGLMFVSAGVVASYRHPAWLIAWQWLVLLVLFSVVRQLARAPAVRHGLLAAVLATGVTTAAYGIYQAAYELPRLQTYYSGNRDMLRHDVERQTGRAIRPDDPYFAAIALRVRRQAVHATFTHPESCASYLALLLPAALGFGIVAWRRRLSTWQPVLALTAAGVIAAALILTRSPGAVLGFRSLLDDWTATWAMIRQYPWLGVGPGNFARYFPRYMLPTAAAGTDDPRNWALDVWASAGVLALAALLAALAGVFIAVRRRLGEAAPTGTEAEPAADSRNWEFYVGGMVGLLLAFVLRAAAVGSSGDILIEGAAAAARSVVWFAAFGLFLSIPWSGPGVVLALAAGLVVCLLNLCFSGGIDFPSVAGPFWAVAALAVAGPGERPLGGRLALFLPVPALAALFLVYLLLVFVPVTGAEVQLRQAHLAQARYHDRNARPTAPADVARLVQFITNRLEQAGRDDPDSVTPRIALASWHLELLRTPADGEQALRELAQAMRLEPDGKEEQMLHFQAHLRLAQHAEAGRQQQLNDAAAALRAVVALAPSESAQLHYRLGDTLLRVHQLPAGYGQLLLAWQEDQAAPGPAYRLGPAEAADAQRLLRGFFTQVVAPALEPPPWGPVRVVPAVFPRTAPAARPAPAPRRRPLLPGAR
jgi:O-antigen ligase